jgi:cytochrome c oxidase assembly factor CtaG
MTASAPNVLGSWTAPLAPTLALLAVVVLYLCGWRSLSRTSRFVPAWRLAAFLAGMGTLWTASTSALSIWTQFLLTAHMVQHLLLMLVAPPLLLLGSPGLVFRCGLARRREPDQRDSFRFAGWGWMQRVGRWLTHPISAGILMVAITIVWHIPQAFALAMRSAGWHSVENATFFASGVLFWWPVILPWPSKRQWPRWTIPLYLLGADLPISVLSAYLAFCDRVVYPCYLAVPRLFGISALNDQVAAAMLMWVAMLLIFVGASVVVIMDLFEPVSANGHCVADASLRGEQATRSAP